MARKLFKALVVLVVVVAALGGAAAVGSTLFQSPPRDAAEFAEWIEAGSRHIDPNRKPPKAKKKRSPRAQPRKPAGPTAAERRYGRMLAAWCIEQERDVAALGYPYDGEAWLARWVALSRSWRARVAALAAPPRFRDERARYLRSWERLEGLGVRLVRTSARSDTVAYLEAYDRWVHTAAANSDAAIAMGADRCAGAIFQGITTS
ncbi:MAG TPA: hypothetical protein VHF23_01340 [Gaiellaceae bacterium]|nr:hypothetical protein [Gaiellaceae bacterium]